MIPRQAFGRTGHMSTRTLFGAAALAQVSQAEADQTLDVLLKYEINHIDVAASYGDAEERVGPWMVEHRQRFFLATKTEERTYQKAREELHRSLERMRVDSVDLWQMHLLVDAREWEVAMGPGGALEAFLEARDQGLTRFLGVTGHGVNAAQMHRRSLERFDFDSVLLPYNYTMMQNPAYAAGFEWLIDECQRRDTAVQTIKSLSRGPWGEKPRSHNTWYEPLTEQDDIDLAVHWALNRPGVFLNTVADIHLLPMVLEAADRFRPADQSELDQAIARQTATPLFT